MKNNDNKKKKIAVIVIAVVILLLVIIGSGVAIGVFRSTKGCRTDFADIQNKKECGGNRQWQNHYLRNWAANTKGKGII